MQVASNQAARALIALRASKRRGAVRRRRRRIPRPGRGVSPLTLDGAVAEIDAQPPVRVAHVAVARVRVERGEQPSAGEVADMAIRRAVCDALR